MSAPDNLDPLGRKSWQRMRARGTACDRGKGLVRDSGLWNQNHVDEGYDPAFLDVLERFVEESGAG